MGLSHQLTQLDLADAHAVAQGFYRVLHFCIDYH